MTIEFCYLIFITANYYSIRYFIIPHFFHKKKYLFFVFSCIAIIALSSYLRALVALYMNSRYFQSSANIDFLELYINSAIAITFWVLVILSGKIILDSIYYQNQLELSEREKIKTELDFLKAQINPHALFNSLNTIYGYIDKNNQVARNILLQFSELLRYQLYDCSQEKVDLEKEMDYIRNYVAFQQLRKEKNLVVDLVISPVQNGFTIAPLMFVVLIENAFKFVSNYADRENVISIRISITDKAALNCIISNSIEPELTSDPSHLAGIGLANLKRRLELLYPNKYVLSVTEEPDLYITALTLYLA